MGNAKDLYDLRENLMVILTAEPREILTMGNYPQDLLDELMAHVICKNSAIFKDIVESMRDKVTVDTMVVAVRCSVNNLNFVPEPIPNEVIDDVLENGHAKYLLDILKSRNLATPEIMLKCLKQDLEGVAPLLERNINNLSEEVQLELLSYNPTLINNIENPSGKLLVYTKGCKPLSIEQVVIFNKVLMNLKKTLLLKRDCISGTVKLYEKDGKIYLNGGNFCFIADNSGNIERTEINGRALIIKEDLFYLKNKLSTVLKETIISLNENVPKNIKLIAFKLEKKDFTGGECKKSPKEQGSYDVRLW